MTERQPLHGWQVREVGAVAKVGRLPLGAGVWASVYATSDGTVPWSISGGLGSGQARSLESAQLAAEDAARRLLSELAKALGGAVQYD